MGDRPFATPSSDRDFWLLGIHYMGDVLEREALQKTELANDLFPYSDTRNCAGNSQECTKKPLRLDKHRCSIMRITKAPLWSSIPGVCSYGLLPTIVFFSL